jgi:hypothetical protein
MIDKFTVFVALASAALAIVAALLLPGDMSIARIVDGNEALTWLGMWTLGALPIAFAMPRVRGAFFGRLRRLPSHAYVMPLWMVRLSIGTLIGQLAGCVVLAVALDHRLFWFAGAIASVGIVLWFSARPRLRERAERPAVQAD